MLIAVLSFENPPENYRHDIENVKTYIFQICMFLSSKNLLNTQESIFPTLPNYFVLITEIFSHQLAKVIIFLEKFQRTIFSKFSSGHVETLPKTVRQDSEVFFLRLRKQQ